MCTSDPGEPQEAATNPEKTGKIHRDSSSAEVAPGGLGFTLRVLPQGV